MIPATTAKTTHNHADHEHDDTAARRETAAVRKPPPEDTEQEQTEEEQTEHDRTEREGSRRYRWDDPDIQALAAKGAVPDAALAARLGRMLGLARKP